MKASAAWLLLALAATGLARADASDREARLREAIAWYAGGTGQARDLDRACEAFASLAKERRDDPVLGYYLGVTTFRGQCGKTEDREAGVKLIAVAARHGLREAQADMGKNFEFGWVDAPDIDQALSWYQKAADNGDGYSLWRVGMSYVDGEGRDKDARRAVEYFQRSIEAGHGFGMSSLAVMYATGDGVEKDFAQALSLYERAAKAGNPHGYRGMAVMYFHGEGMPADPVQAWILYSQGVESGNDPEDKLRRNIESEMSFDELQRAKAALEDWKRERDDAAPAPAN